MKLNPGAFGACVAKIQARGKMTETEARSILQETANRAEQMRRNGQPDPFVTAAKELADSLKRQAQEKAEDAILNAEKRKAILDAVDTKGGIKAAIDTIRQTLHVTNSKDAGSALNVETVGRGIGGNWVSALNWALHKAGVDKIAISGEMDVDIANELLALRSGDKVKESGNNIAKQIAAALSPAMEKARERLNGVGARIGDAIDYVAHQEHDPSKMRNAAGWGKTADEAFAVWWGKEQPRWDEKTFEGLTPKDGETMAQARDRFGRSVYDALLTGVHLTSKGVGGIETPGYVPPAFEGSRNLAKKLSQSRTIIYKDGQAWVDHQRDFGMSPSLTAGVVRSLVKSGQQVALMDRWGTNPMANLNQVLDSVAAKYRGDVDGVKTFQGKTQGVKNVMGYLDGSNNIPANEMAAKIGQSLRTEEVLSSLGAVGITHFMSIWPTVQGELVHHGFTGTGRLQTMGNLMSALVKGKGPAERMEVASDLGAYAGGLSRELMSQYNGNDALTGKLSAIAGTFMKYTGVHYVYDNTQAAVREMLAHKLGRNTNLDFNGLDWHMQQSLGRYGIGADEWNLMRSVDDLTASQGRKYMTPSDIAKIDDGKIGDLLRSRGEADLVPTPEAIAKFKQDLTDKYVSYLQGASDQSVVTPGVKEKALLLQGTRPGSGSGELMRFLAQFKMWPVAAFNQILMRDIALRSSGWEAARNVLTIASLSMVAGYLRMAANDTLKGNPVRPVTPESMLAGLAQGGGMGILGDFLFGETNRMGGGFLSTLAGPVIGDVANLTDLVKSGIADTTGPGHKNGQFADLWPNLAHFGVRHIPFANLAYLKGSLDYLLWYHLFEAASPGWWERSNRKLQRDTGRSMTGYSPGGGVPYGVPGLYLKNNAGSTSGIVAKFL